MATSKEQKITITASTGLSKDEAEKMRTDAEAHAEDDKRKLAEIEARNQLDNRVYQTEKLLRENREKLAEGDAKSVEEALEKAKSALAGGSLESIEAANKELESASHKVAEVLYNSAKAQGAGGAGTPPGAGGASGGSGGAEPKKPGEGDVIDAEYVDVDETKQPN